MTLTEWYPATIKPVRKGYYEVRNDPTVILPKKVRLNIAKYRYWNGSYWITYKESNELSIMGAFGDCHQWRGITK